MSIPPTITAAGQIQYSESLSVAPASPLHHSVSFYSLPPTTLHKLKTTYLYEHSLYFSTPDLPKAVKPYTKDLTGPEYFIFTVEELQAESIPCSLTQLLFLQIPTKLLCL